MNPIARFLSGALIPLQAVRTLAAHPSLLMLGLLPMGLALILYGLGFQAFSDALTGWVAGHGAWSSALAVLGQVLFVVIGLFTFTWVATLLSIPLNDFLAERTERFSNPPISKNLPFRLTFLIRTTAIDFMKTLFAGALGIGVLVFSWIPVLNVLAGLLSAWLLTFQYVSYPQTRREMGMLASLLWLLKHAPEALGFGLVHFALFMIPGLGAFLLPIAVVGGTLLFAQTEARRLPASQTAQGLR